MHDALWVKIKTFSSHKLVHALPQVGPMGKCPNNVHTTQPSNFMLYICCTQMYLFIMIFSLLLLLVTIRPKHWY